jgi:hypothetical protein
MESPGPSTFLPWQQLYSLNLAVFAGLHNLRLWNISATRIQLVDYSFLPANVEWLYLH